MAEQETVSLTRAQIEDLRRIIHNDSAPLGNRLQDVSSRLYFALEGAGWSPTPAPAQVLDTHEQRAVLADLLGLECLINYHDAQEAGAEAIEPGLGKTDARRVLDLLKLGREIIAEDPELWTDEQKRVFELRFSERAAAAAAHMVDAAIGETPAP
ncbi:hypothetical protein [Variovorax sp. V15]|uniref:hypothetical protein n=1 Tax=Variovorax sp. V15 TaxID=3065952 RepID=UPI0034E8DF1F